VHLLRDNQIPDSNFSGLPSKTLDLPDEYPARLKLKKKRIKEN